MRRHGAYADLFAKPQTPRADQRLQPPGDRGPRAKLAASAWNQPASPAEGEPSLARGQALSLATGEGDFSVLSTGSRGGRLPVRPPSVRRAPGRAERRFLRPYARVHG